MDSTILNKLRHYCAYQERCHEEVRTKLLSLKVYGDRLEEVISQLVQEDFLNEERYAKAYAGGKFRMQKWGRERIRKELRFRKISEYCIRQAMEEIPEEDYVLTLDQLIRSAKKRYASGTPAQRHYKLMNYLLSKGYERSLITERLKP